MQYCEFWEHELSLHDYFINYFIFVLEDPKLRFSIRLLNICICFCIFDFDTLVYLCRSQSKSPPQDVLLKLEKEKSFEDVAKESSMLVFNLGLSKRKCCLLMNGLVYNSNEVHYLYVIVVK